MSDFSTPDGRVTVLHGDVLERLAELPDESVDAICTDPPYGLEFMGKEWDRLWNEGGDTFSKDKQWRLRPAGYKPRYVVNRKCAICGLWARDKNPCRCASPEWQEPQKAKGEAHQARRMQEWHYRWAVAASLLALDPGSLETGWAIFSDGQPRAWGVASARDVPMHDRHHKLFVQLDWLREHYEIEEVAWERPTPSWRRPAPAIFTSLDPALKDWCRRHGLKAASYLPSQVKCGVTWGGATKDDMKAAVLVRWPKAGIPSGLKDHVYDAIAVGDYHLTVTGLEARVRGGA